jgi:hypothetical protein
MSFHLDFNPVISQYKITHQDGVLMMGSCFSEHIAERLSLLKFQVETNPFGIVFNPESIHMALSRTINKHYFTEEDVFENEGKWFCLEAHSSVSASTKQELLNTLNQTIDIWNSKLHRSKYLVITFGSAFCYSYKEKELIVANCHKLPATLFEKKLSETDSILKSYQDLIEKIKTFNPQLTILFTVSPVKHLRDGVVENNLSKAVLIQTVHQLVKYNSNCFYFPAYELVNDDLRDYRFYEADMAHPNKQAVDYVWEKFSNVYFNDEIKIVIDEIQEINQAMNHRPFNIESESHMKFKKTFYQKCVELSTKYIWLNLETELNYFSN